MDNYKVTMEKTLSVADYVKMVATVVNLAGIVITGVLDLLIFNLKMFFYLVVSVAILFWIVLSTFAQLAWTLVVKVKITASSRLWLVFGLSKTGFVILAYHFATSSVFIEYTSSTTSSLPSSSNSSPSPSTWSLTDSLITRPTLTYIDFRLLITILTVGVVACWLALIAAIACFGVKSITCWPSPASSTGSGSLKAE